VKRTVFTGAGVAIVTPMKDDGSIDYPMLGSLIDWQIKEKTDAIIVCGTTGESACLNHHEHVKVIDFAVKHIDKRVPVIAGTGSNDTRYAVELTREAKAQGADGALLVTPYYNKTSQLGLVRHFNTVADATDLPLIVYNVPSRTGLNIKPETYAELSKHPNIVATKEANGDLVSVVKTRSLCGDELAMYSGTDEIIVPILSMGGIGVISVLSNICPGVVHEMCASWFAGDCKKAAQLQADYLELIEALFIDVSPIPVKAALNRMGWRVGECRLPLTELNEHHTAVLRAAMVKQGLLK